jgi:hypothetical protein
VEIGVECRMGCSLDSDDLTDCKVRLGAKVGVHKGQVLHFIEGEVD